MVTEDEAEADCIAIAKAKFLCSCGGRILPRPSASTSTSTSGTSGTSITPAPALLRYVGGENRMLSVTRTISYSDLMNKVTRLFEPNLTLKYQLPNEDLDTLISVTCDEDVENMMDEYDMNESREGSSRLRIFLFPATRGTEGEFVQATSGSCLLRSNPPSDSSSAGGFQMAGYENCLDSVAVDGEVRRPKSMASEFPRSPSYASRDSSSIASQTMPYVQAESLQTKNALGETCPPPSSVIPPNLSLLRQSNSVTAQPIWDTKKIWEEAFASDQRDEKQALEPKNCDAPYEKPPQQGTGPETTRVASIDKLPANFFPVSSSDSCMDGNWQSNLPPKNATNHKEKQKAEEVGLDLIGASMSFRPPDVTTGTAKSYRAADLSRVAAKVPQGYDENRKSNGGESEQELLYRRMENLSVINKASPINTSEAMSESMQYLESRDLARHQRHSQAFRGHDGYGSDENFTTMYRDILEIGSVDDGDVLNQRQHVYVATASHQGQQLGGQYSHYFGRGQQVYRQGREIQEPMRQKPPPSYGSNTYLPRSGTTALKHQHSLPSTPQNMRTPAHATTRFPSPLKKQGISDLSQMRARGSLQSDQILANSISTYDPWNAQIQDSQVFKSATNWQSIGSHLPSSQTDAFGLLAAYETSGGKMLNPEKFVLGNYDEATVGSHQYLENRMESRNQSTDEAYYVEKNMEVSTQSPLYSNDSQDSSVMHQAQNISGVFAAQ